ncbi:MAG: hypothetical protein Q9160_002820 [Pyrenula sp. 1 TL-2023]
MVKRSSRSLNKKCNHKRLPLKPYLSLSEDNKQSLDGKFAELQRKNKDSEKNVVKLQQKNKDSEKKLEQKIKEHARDISSIAKLEETVEDLRYNLASKYQDKQRYESAAQQYRALKDLKNEQRNRLSKNTSGTDQAVHDAKTAELKYSHKLRKMLIQAKKYPEAEAELERLLKRRNEFYSNDSSLQTSGRDYAFRNAFELACVRVELEKYDRAINQLEEIWRKRYNISPKCISDVNDGVIQLLDDLEAKNRGSHVEQVLKIAFEGNSKTAPSPSVSAIAKRGFSLYDKGKSGKATKYLQLAWNKSSPADKPNEKLKLGWYLARSRCYADNFAKALPLLNTISQLPDTKGPPSKDKIKTLLALAQLKTGDIVTAKDNAQTVFNKHKTKKILPEALDCYQADILLHAIAQEGHYVGKYTNAVKIWEEVYNDGTKLPLDAAVHHGKQLKYHAAAGWKLADEY